MLEVKKIEFIVNTVRGQGDVETFKTPAIVDRFSDLGVPFSLYKTTSVHKDSTDASETELTPVTHITIIANISGHDVPITEATANDLADAMCGAFDPQVLLTDLLAEHRKHLVLDDYEADDRGVDERRRK